MSKLTEMINEAIKNSNLKQYEIAECFNIKHNNITHWKSGSTPIPLDKVIKFCKICNVDHKEMYELVIKTHHTSLYKEIQSGHLAINI